MSETKITKTLARKIAAKLIPSDADDWDVARDEVDLLTGSDLDAWQLDMLTDWVCAIIHGEPLHTGGLDR